MVTTAVCTVREASAADVGKGIARMSKKMMGDLGLGEKDAVLLKGDFGNAGVVICQGVLPKGKIALDVHTRTILGTMMGQDIKVVLYQCHDVDTLRLSPANTFRLKDIENLAFLNLYGRAFTRDQHVFITHMKKEFPMIVDGYSPTKRLVRVTEKTKIIVADEPTSRFRKSLAPASYADVGGLKAELKNLRELVEYPLFQPEIYEHLGTIPPRGMLLHGPPGTGKTLMARAVAHEAFAHFIALTSMDLVSPIPGFTDKILQAIFDEARACEPSIIYIDEIDAIAAKREDNHDPNARAAVTALLTHMDGLQRRGQVIIIASTNRPNVLDEAIRRPGRFDREIFVGPPDKVGRREILDIHTRHMPLNGVDEAKIANDTHGFVGADIAALTREAAMNVVRKHEREDGEDIEASVIKAMTVDPDDFEAAAVEVGPSIMRDVAIDIPDIKWDDIGGLEEAKQQLREVVEWPLLHEEIFLDMNVNVPKGCLMYGPPGTGKTMLAKAVANATKCNFINVKGPEFLDKYVGETERKVRDVFKKARQAKPCILFFDEADAIMPERGTGCSTGGTRVMERTISTFLAEMDGLEELKGVTVIAATNRPELIDSAIVRAGRLSRKIFVGYPDEDARTAIFDIHLHGTKTDGSFTPYDYAVATDGYSGADIANVVSEAKMLAIREFVKKKVDGKPVRSHAIGREHMEQAVEMCKPRKDRDVSAYATQKTMFGSD
jgi:transitional endoplasmic reticulum ATPase